MRIEVDDKWLREGKGKDETAQEFVVDCVKKFLYTRRLGMLRAELQAKLNRSSCKRKFDELQAEVERELNVQMERERKRLGL